MSPAYLPLTLNFDGNLHHQKEQQSAHKFLQKLAQCHSDVTDALKRAQEKAKQRHDKHRKATEFNCRDQVWLQISKQWFRGSHHKVYPTQYGPYTIIERMGGNAYRLDLPP